MSALWKQLVERSGRSLSNAQEARLRQYLHLLAETNRSMNLTRIDEPAEMEVLHVGDALTLLPFLPPDEHTLADVGSGGGVPGIPLAVVRPEIRVTLIEATGKKAAFLSRAVEALGLSNVKVIPQRAEVVARGPMRESFDVVAARAVGQLAVLAEWCLPLVRKGGSFLAMKGARIEEELPAARRAIQLLNGAEPVIHAVELPEVEHHVIVEVLKVGRTDAKYPRPGGQAKSKPLE